MRILVVPFTFPWPSENGSRIRAANVVKALAGMGEVDVFTIYDPHQDHYESDSTNVPPGVPVARMGAAPRGRLPRSRIRQLRWLVAGDVPSVLYGRRYEEPREAFRRWVGDARYDLAWFHREEGYLTLGPLVDAPAILDLDVIDEEWIALRLAASGERGYRRGFEAWKDRVVNGKSMRLFTALHHRLAPEVRAMIVCNEEDRSRLAVPNGEVIPNGFDAPDVPRGRVEVGSPPTILFQGILTRPAKIMAAEYLLTRVAPLVRTQIPDVSIRLAGRAGPNLQQHDDPPRVVVTGWVPDMADELARADIVAVPMRYGGGTLLKVLESFAHRVPVVATSVGARGLDAEHGTHLLVADTPEDFAAACVRLLRDEELRRRLADNAHRLFLERFQWHAIHDRIRELAASALSAGTRTI